MKLGRLKRRKPNYAKTNPNEDFQSSRSISWLFVAMVALMVVSNLPQSALSLSSSLSNDRVLVIKQVPGSASYKQTKQNFKENFEKLTIHVKENTPIGTKLTEIAPPEEMQRPDDKIMYAIVGGPDQISFRLQLSPDSNNKVELLNEVNFDYESAKQNYNLLIRATSLYLRYEVELDILVTDENDNKPQLEDFAIVFNNYKNHFPTGAIGRVPANDLDTDDILHYKVLSGNNAQFIFVNETNGEIQLSPWLNNNVPFRPVMEVAVSDGVNEPAVAKLVLSVNLVTESMLHNSVVLRLDGIGRDEFLSKKYDAFLSQMARLLGTDSMYSTKNIVVFNVEEISSNSVPLEASLLQYKPYHGSKISNSSLSINVSFSARTQDNDVEAYMSPQYIEERIYLSRAQLSQNLEVQVAQIQDNLCVGEPCQNYQECQPTYKFERAPKSFYANKYMLFRPVQASQSYMCTCPITFTGVKHKSECNLQINQCFSKPCLNGGVCHRHESGYTCECKPEFLGARCEHSFANSTCQSISKGSQVVLNGQTQVSSNVIDIDSQQQQQQQQTGGMNGRYSASLCSGKSRCVNNNKFYASKPTSLLAPGGFSCQGCLYPQWSTELCQLRARSFDKNSYITLPGLRRRHRFHLQLQFTTVQNDALLLYNGRYNDKYDFIALEIVESRLKFSYSLGSGSNSVYLIDVPVSNGDWHKVTIDYRDRNVTLIADDCDPIIDEALARSQGSSSTRRCSITSYYSPGADAATSKQVTTGLAPDYRMLDLMSPLIVGSPPSLGVSSEFQMASHGSFFGCISDIYIDHQLVDLSSPLQDFGTQAGCPERRTFCQQHSCNGMPCQDAYGAGKCACGDERVGKSCEIYLSNERVRRFSGNSYLSFSPMESVVPANWQVSMHFRTIQPNGVLLKIILDSGDSILLELQSGGLRLAHRSRSLSLSKLPLDDGEWHFVELLWSSESLLLQVDYNPNLSVQTTEFGNIVGSIMKSVTVGASFSRISGGSSSSSVASSHIPSTSNLQDAAAPQADSSAEFTPSTVAPEDFAAAAVNSLYSNSSQSFVGCIYGVNISDNAEWWLMPSDERNVERGCPILDPCETSPCPANSRCVRKGMNQRRCICNFGHVGDDCRPVCELNPCQGENSKCLPARAPASSSYSTDLTAAPRSSGEPLIDMFTLTPSAASAQYTCECEPHRSGKNCEHQLSAKCPSNWWGKPVAGSGNSSICGLCNCDESKGFDGDCDKTTGQCYCKPSYYQPSGSDYCLACDCYLVGSLSSACNQTSGQCKCRSGVVGRRCDTCTSQYAEVTLRGCDVIYDACPKTFSDGIWWEKTQLDQMATQQCPPATSTGTATRFCHKTDGWQKPNLFDCISSTFADLYTQFKFLEENKFQLSPMMAAKIAQTLRQALNETIANPSMQLYGSDMYISFRLLHNLIQHESHQTGLNLTHRQERAYIRNIVESVNYLLEPEHAENWPEIARRSPDGGAEHLLSLIDTYGRVLIETQSDTFTQPFEINTNHFTFGLDTLSMNQLWDLNKWSTASTGGGLGALFGSSASASGSSHFPSSPPYATEPFDDIRHGAGPKSPHAEPPGHFNTDGVSIYIESSQNVARADSSASIVIPKYDNYAANPEASGQDSSRAIIPLRALRIKSPQELTPLFHAARSRAKREEIVIPDYSGASQQQARQKDARVAYSIYKTLGPLLPANYDSTVQNRFGNLASANSPLIWLTVRPYNSTEFLTKGIQPKITYMLKIFEPTGKTRPQCAIWEFTSHAGPKGNASAAYGPKQTGRFTTKGCEIRGVQSNHRLRHKYEHVNCSCDRIGAVTVLMDNVAQSDYLSSDETNLRELTQIIALAISLVILAATLFVLTCVRGHSIKSNSNSINKNLVFVLLVIESLILYTMLSRHSLNQFEYQCKLVAIFLHYFSISLFAWLLVNAIHFYRMLTELRDINHGPMRFYHVLGYAIPAFFVSVAVGLRMELFGNHLFCWLSIHEPIIWSMFGPIILVTVMTMVLFVLALSKSLPIKEESAGAEIMRSHMLINTLKTPIVGLYWLMSVYSVNESLGDGVLLLPVCTVAKSLALFVLICIVDRYVRYNLYVSWLRFNGHKTTPAAPAAFMGDDGASSQPALGIGQHQRQWIQGAGGFYADNKHHQLPGSVGHLYAPGYATNPSGHIMTPGFQSSCGDVFQPELLAFSAASTTSRSSATSSSASSVGVYRDHRSRHLDELDDESALSAVGYGRTGSRHRHRSHKKHSSHKKRHHHHHHHRHHHHHHHRHRSHHHQEQDGDNESNLLHGADSSRRYESRDEAAAAAAAAAASGYGRSRRTHRSHRHHSNGYYDLRPGSSGQQLVSSNQEAEQQQLASSHSSDVDQEAPPKKSKESERDEDEQQTVPMELSSGGGGGEQQEEQKQEEEEEEKETSEMSNQHEAANESNREREQI